jgi:hypothetical protein
MSRWLWPDRLIEKQDIFSRFQRGEPTLPAAHLHPIGTLHLFRRCYRTHQGSADRVLAGENLAPMPSLDRSGANGPMSFPRARFLSQQFVEELYSANRASWLRCHLRAAR